MTNEIASPGTSATPARDTFLCELSGVSHQFNMPSGNPRTVLDNISLGIAPNQVVALLGPSGCGKSTILRILAGLTRPTRGEVRYHGAPLIGLNPGVAMVFQSFALFPWMTVLGNIEVVLKAAGLSPDRIAKKIADAIQLVGLTGFEEAYPRELSGGMKQRVGMARALSLEPEILFMDEPFSQVDALTAESLRAEVLDIWSNKERNPSSVVIVSHDIREVAFMADRIVVLGANPGVVRTVVDNRLSRPRDYRSAGVLRLVDQLHDIITGHELPDVVIGKADSIPPPTMDYEPLPEASPNEIIGLLEFLDARGGKDDVFRIATETNREFGSMIAIVKAAEMLDWVDTPRRAVVLTSDGRRLVDADAHARIEMWRAKLLDLRLFKDLYALIEKHGKIEKNLVMQIIALRLPQENYERTFDTFVIWGRFGDLFAYDDRTEELTLQ